MNDMNKNRAVALVTGASRGIGRAIAVRLAEAGFNIALTARDRIKLEETASGCRGTETLVIPGDLASPQTPQALVDQTVGKWGRLDVLVNNGALRKARATSDDWGLFVDVNLKALMELTRAALPHLEKSPDASVVNLSSIA